MSCQGPVSEPGRLDTVSPEPTSGEDKAADLTSEQLQILNNEATQAEYRRQFQLQMKRRECPGCGE